MNEGLYNYCSAIINWDDGGQRTRKQFRYYNIWSLAPGFKKKVEDSWRKPIRGTSMYQLVGKLNRLKVVFKDLNMSKLSNVELKTDMSMEALIECQEKMQQDPMKMKLSVTTLISLRRMS